MSPLTTDQNSAQTDTVCLSKRIINQNCSIMKFLVSPNWQNISQLRCFTQPMLKPTSDIKVPQAKNELAKFCDNQTMFELLITGLKITGLVP